MPISISISYDIPLIVLSLVAAIVLAGGGFHLITRRSGSVPGLLFGGVFMGLGVAAMHFTGMAAMRVWTKSAGRRRHGFGHFGYALHGNASGHFYRQVAQPR